jgi:hypothetical protein
MSISKSFYSTTRWPFFPLVVSQLDTLVSCGQTFVQSRVWLPTRLKRAYRHYPPRGQRRNIYRQQAISLSKSQLDFPCSGTK